MGAEAPHGVVYIGFHAFDGCTSLKNVTVPGSVKIIDEYAFQNCTGLEDVTVGSGVEFIEFSAFDGCTALETVILGKGLKEIGYRSFYGCKNLESIVIPDGVETIDYFAFNGCTKLASVTLPDSVEIIRSNVFENTAYYNDANNWVDGALYINNHLIKADVTGDYTVKEGTRVIAGEAFRGNINLDSVILPESLISIGAVAFAETNISEISIPSGLEYLGWNIVFNTPYADNSSNWENGLMYIDNCLIEIDSDYTGACRIKDGTRLIAEAMFCENEGVTSVVIPEGITEISEEMFMFSNIKSVTLPSSIKSVGGYAFHDVPLEINYLGSENSWNKIDFGRYKAELHFVKVNFLCPHKGTMTYVKAKNATCTAVGKKAYYKCSDCGFCYEDSAGAKKISDLSKWGNIPALAHKGGTATCKAQAVCTVCKKPYGTVDKNNHTSLITLPAKAATYKTTGLTAGKKCTVCNTVTLRQNTVDVKKLSAVSGIKATPSSTSLKLTWNKVTGAEKYELQYIGGGKTLTKTVTANTITLSSLKTGTAYTVKIKAVAGSNKGAEGSLATATKPSKVKIKKAKSTKRKIASLTWGKVTGATRYQVQYSTSKSFKKKTTKTTKSTKLTIKKLKSKKNYYVRVRAYKVVNGQKLYGSWSSVKKVKIK